MKTIIKNLKISIVLGVGLPCLFLTTCAWADKLKCTVFVTDYMERGYPTSLPKEIAAKPEMRIFASPGEYEPCTFSIRAGHTSLSNVSVMPSVLSGSAGQISRQNIDVRVVKTFNQRKNDNEILPTECYLHKFETVDIFAYTTQRFWVTVYVPEGTMPGIYNSKVLIKSGANIIEEVLLEMEVLAIKLSAPEEIAYFMFAGPNRMPKSVHNLEYQRKCFEDMVAHGMTTAIINARPPMLSDGTVDMTKDENPQYLPMYQTMEDLVDTGLARPGRPVMWLGAPGEGIFDENMLESLYSQARENNWPEILLFVIDEPREPEQLKLLKDFNSKLADFLKKHPEFKIRTTTAIFGDNDSLEKYGEFYDVWIALIARGSWTAQGGVIEKARSMGKELWSYDCALGPTSAHSSRYYFGLWAWRTGVKGASYWAYADYQGVDISGKRLVKGWDTWDIIFEGRSDISLLYSYTYPEPTGPIPSVGWEGVREGVDDYRYLTTLQKLIDRAKTAGRNSAAAEAEKVLKDIESQVRVEGNVEAYEKNRSDGLNELTRPNPQPEIPSDSYNQFRYRIAKQIMKLEASFR